MSVQEKRLRAFKGTPLSTVDRDVFSIATIAELPQSRERLHREAGYEKCNTHYLKPEAGQFEATFEAGSILLIFLRRFFFHRWVSLLCWPDYDSNVGKPESGTHNA